MPFWLRRSAIVLAPQPWCTYQVKMSRSVSMRPGVLGTSLQRSLLLKLSRPLRDTTRVTFPSSPNKTDRALNRKAETLLIGETISSLTDDGNHPGATGRIPSKHTQQNLTHASVVERPHGGTTGSFIEELGGRSGLPGHRRRGIKAEFSRSPR